VIVADPAPLPVIVVETRAAVVVPCGTKKLEGETVAVEGLLLDNVMKTPPAGAGTPKVTGKFTVPPSGTVTFAGRRIPLVAKVHCSWEKSTVTALTCSVMVLLLVTWLLAGTAPNCRVS
jgi:hypothetical protein